MNSSQLGRGEPDPSVRRSTARRSTRRTVAAILSPVVASVGLVGIASPAQAAINPVTLPHDISVFPMRDFLGVGGWGVGAQMDVRVIRDGVQIGSAGPLELASDLELNGFAEVNHPGGACWNGVTPNLIAGDRVEAIDATGEGEFTIVQNVEVTQAATKVDLDGDGIEDDVIARGMASNVAGTARIDPGLVEQRIINPDLKTVPAIDRRDVRAIFGAGGVADGVETLGRITWDDPAAGSTDPHWTATYENVGADVADLLVAGQSRMLAWERTNTAGDRIGMTLWEYGEVGGPGMGGCPLGDNYAVGGASPKNINIATSEQSNLTLSGTARNVDTVKVTVDDHNPATPAVTGDATVAKPTSLDPAVAMAGNTTWSASLPMGPLRALDDDTLVASASYGVVQEPAAGGTTRTSTPIGGANLNILKDMTAPAKPTAFPGVDGGTVRSTSAQSVTVSPANEIEDTVRYRVGGTAATTADPTAASPEVPLPLPVTQTQTVKARSYDAAGNPSPISTFNYVIAAAGPAGAPTGVAGEAGDASATLVWRAPTDDGGSAITGYRLQAFLVNATTGVPSNTPARSVLVPLADVEETLNPGELFAPLGGLTNGQSYVFRVGTVNGNGTTYSPVTTTPVRIGTAAPGDTVAPTVSARTPLSGATAAVGVNVTATFSETVTGVSTTSMVLRTPAGATVPAAVSYNATSRVATLNPTANLAAGTTYTASLTGGAAGIRDSAGNALANVSWSFTTNAAANVAPTVTAQTPLANATGVARASNISATFSEAVTGVAAGTFAVRLASAATTSTPIPAVLTNPAGNRWVLNPNANLAANTLYRVTLTSGIRDTAGAPLAAVTWTFRTGA